MTDIAFGLGIDAGGTATRWHLVDRGGATLATGAAAPMTGHVYTLEARSHARATLSEIAKTVRANADPTHILAGITGLDEGAEAAIFYTRAFAEVFALPPAHVRIENDIHCTTDGPEVLTQPQS